MVWLSPILPYINDTKENIDGILDLCIEAKVYGVICFGMGFTLREGNREYFYKQLDLKFTELFVAKPHVFISKENPLAEKEVVTMEELEPYSYLSFEQGEHNSFYFSEEIFSTFVRSKNIRVRDRVTLFNLLIGLNGYTVSSGVIDAKLNGENIIAVPLAAEGDMHIGVVTNKKLIPSKLGEKYMEALVKYTAM